MISVLFRQVGPAMPIHIPELGLREPLAALLDPEMKNRQALLFA